MEMVHSRGRLLINLTANFPFSSVCLHPANIRPCGWFQLMNDLDIFPLWGIESWSLAICSFISYSSRVSSSTSHLHTEIQQNSNCCKLNRLAICKLSWFPLLGWRWVFRNQCDGKLASKLVAARRGQVLLVLHRWVFGGCWRTGSVSIALSESIVVFALPLPDRTFQWKCWRIRRIVKWWWLATKIYQWNPSWCWSWSRSALWRWPTLSRNSIAWNLISNSRSFPLTTNTWNLTSEITNATGSEFSFTILVVFKFLNGSLIVFEASRVYDWKPEVFLDIFSLNPRFN